MSRGKGVCNLLLFNDMGRRQALEKEMKVSHYDAITTKLHESLAEIKEATEKIQGVSTRANHLSLFDCDLIDTYTRTIRAAIAKMEGMREAKSILEFEQKAAPTHTQGIPNVKPSLIAQAPALLHALETLLPPGKRGVRGITAEEAYVFRTIIAQAKGPTHG